jgi:putative permease
VSAPESIGRPSSRDHVKLAFVLFLLLFFGFIFIWTSALRPTAFLTLLNLILLNPVIHWLERKRLSRTQAILIVFAISTFVVVFGITNGVRLLHAQWSTLVETLPSLWVQIVDRIGGLQGSIQSRLGISLDVGASEWLLKFGTDTQNWLLTHLPRILGDAASAAFLVPVFSFFLLRDGRRWMNHFFRLIPDRYHDSTVQVIEDTSNALGDFLRAKVIEATSVGLLAFLGFVLIGAPYAGLFAFIVGITNVIPYLGIILGAVPPLILFSLTADLNGFFWPTVIVLIIVNVIDGALIFPLFVAKIVNLSPIALLTAVAVGQEYYGLVGMLIAVPLASILKIFFQKARQILYDPK